MSCPHLYTRYSGPMFQGSVDGTVICAMCGDLEFGKTLTGAERKHITSINERTDGPDHDLWWKYESELYDFFRFPA